eukprot:1700659-Rhodomonas_salina.2
MPGPAISCRCHAAARLRLRADWVWETVGNLQPQTEDIDPRQPALPHGIDTLQPRVAHGVALDSGP